mgnify:FL=1
MLAESIANSKNFLWKIKYNLETLAVVLKHFITASCID